MYCKLLLKTYNEQFKKLNKKKKTSDEEINRLQALRKVLIEKNLAGIYSDEIFKEQNAIIEEKLIAAYEAQSNELIDKYDINAIITFIEDKLSDLSTLYSASNIDQLRFLLSTIFYSGFQWSYPGYSNYKISPVYQAIRDADKPGVNVGCRAWIRTKINGSKVRCPTIRRPGKVTL